jgi:hypothetical protein
MLTAVGAVLAWFAAQLARFLGEPPDLDAMIVLRESLVFCHQGLDGLIAANGGIHPPLVEALTSVMFVLFGDEPRSQQLLSIVLFVVVAAAVERLLVPWLTAGKRVVAALVVAICPALAISMFLVSREGMMLAVLVTAIAFAMRFPERHVALGAILAILPLIKETGIVLVLPFAISAATHRGSPLPPLKRAVRVLAPAIGAALLWQFVLLFRDARPWGSWVFSTHANDGSYVVALRAMFGLEGMMYLRQNLANGLIVNFLWLPTLLSLATLVLLRRREAPRDLRRAIALVAGLALVYAWTTLPFPTWTIPRYAVPLTLCVVLIALLGVPLWPARAQPAILAGLLTAFVLGAWSPIDPISRSLFGVTTIAGQPFYDTDSRHRGPDRIVMSLGVLHATRGMNARLRQIYASGASVVTGDCNALKLGEKLYTVGLHPDTYAGALPGVHALRCIPLSELPPDAGRGADRIALVRLPEDERKPLPLTGPSIVVIR